MLLSLTWKPFPACHRAVDEDELLRAVLRVPGLCDEDLALIAGVVLRLLKVTWWCAEAPLGVSQARVPQAVQLCDQYLELLCQHPNLGPACIAVLANGFGQLPVRIQPRVYQIITGIDAEIGEASLALAGHLDASQLEDAVRLLMAHEAAP